MSNPVDRAADVIGIDLGTTNCALAWASGEAIAAERVSIRGFEIPQLLREGEVAKHPVLPSFLYFGRSAEVTPGSFDLPWAPADAEVELVGVLAREAGARVPGRLVASAKSWLCHAQVDRTKAILPWGSKDRQISPVEASSRYLMHLRRAWNHLHARLDESRRADRQDVVVTVPASFDEAARELTVESARLAGFSHISLLEEPQAALYAWIDRLGEAWAEDLEPGQVILVIDVGGGTTDLSLIRVSESSKGEPTLGRYAVGRHLMLGGDNMDLALAHIAEGRMGGPQLDATRWHGLTQRCRAAKEELLRRGGAERLPVQVLGSGSAVIAGALKAELTRNDVEQALLDGFFPLVSADAQPRAQRRAGLAELGLPYEADPAITRHLAEFLRLHAEEEGFLVPDAVLFNGGALKGAGLRRRMVRQLKRWSEELARPAPRLLEGAPLDLAVARGAAYYGVVRRGLGVRIGGGSARAFYVQVEMGQAQAQSREQQSSSVRALCVAPHGMEEDTALHISSHPFRVRANQPVSFQLMASTARLNDVPGELVEVERAAMEPLPPILTVLRFGKPENRREIPVRLATHLTAVGTLELWCESLETDHRWRLELQVRGSRGGGPATAAEEHAPADVEHLPESVLELAGKVLRAALAPGQHAAPAGLEAAPSATNLARLLPTVLGQERAQWSLSTARHLWQELFELRGQRNASEEAEARWLNLGGYCLRPGFGYALDDWRINELWKLFHSGTTWPRSDRCRAEWWTLWRRISGGMSAGQQNHAFGSVEKLLLAALQASGGKGKKTSKTKSGGRRLAAREQMEMLMALASFERVEPDRKKRLGDALVAQLGQSTPERQVFWVLARIGARQPLYGPVNQVLAPAETAPWLDALLALEQPALGPFAETLISLGRRTGDRIRDIGDAQRARIRARLEQAGVSAEPLEEPEPLDQSAAAALFGESLPPGLVLGS